MTLEQRVSFEGEDEEITILEPGDENIKTFRFQSVNGVENRYLPVKISCDYLTEFGRVRYEYRTEGKLYVVDKSIDDQESTFSLALRSADGKRQGKVTWSYYPKKGVFSHFNRRKYDNI